MRKAIGIIGIAVILYALYEHLRFQKTFDAATVFALDDTDPLVVRPSAEDIITTAEVGDSKWNSTSLTLLKLSEYETTQSATYSLNRELIALSNPNTRSKTITDYKEKIRTGYTTMFDSIREKSHSSIYMPLMTAIEQLKRVNAHTKTVFIYSNLCEHSQLLDIYTFEGDRLLTDHPNAVIEKFLAAFNPTHLYDITIHIEFQPRNEVEAEKFHRMEKIYITILENAGATVLVHGKQIKQ